MHPLLRFALWFCPREYRRTYGPSIAADIQARNLPVAAGALDLIWQGIVMRTEDAARDVSFAARSLAKAPLYAAVVVLAIGLATGANVAVGSVLEGVLFHSLPYPNAQRLVVVSETPGRSSLSYPEGTDIAARSATLSGIALTWNVSMTLTGRGTPARLAACVVNGEYFSVLGAHPQLGRLLGRKDLGRRNIVLSDAAWHAYFAGSPRAIGALLRLNDKAFSVVGVVAPGFRDPFLKQSALWVAVDPRNLNQNARGNYYYEGIARLRPGVGIPAARADLARVVSGLYREYPQNHGVYRGVSLVPLIDAIVGAARSLLWLFYAAVAIVLLVACANIANLQFARLALRESELAVRSALGAPRGRILAQLTTEVGLLMVCGGVLGLFVGWATLRGASVYGRMLLPRWENVALDLPVFAYTAGVVLLATLLTGVLPGMLYLRALAPGLRGAGRGTVGSVRRVREGLVVAEVALAIALVISAGLVMRSFVNTTNLPLGFNPSNLYDVRLGALPSSRYGSPQSEMGFVRRILTGLREIPGVSAAAAADGAPFDGGGVTTGLLLPGRANPHTSVAIDAVVPGFFAAMQIPFLYGRDFNAADRANSRPVAIVNASFARRFFGTTNVVGDRVQPGICMSCTAAADADFPVLTIVGVAANARAAYQLPYIPDVFFPMTQLTSVRRFVVRTNGRSAGLTRAIDAVFARTDPELPPPRIWPYSTLLSQSSALAGFETVLFASLALLALVLALSGVYAVTAYGVQQRLHEFGIRTAVGATSADLARSVLGGALRQSAIGIALGLVVAASSAHLLASLLFRTSPLDPEVFAAVVALLVVCTVVAALAPALRAARIQPAAALRYE